MIWDAIHGNWNKVKGSTKERWSRLARGEHASTERDQTDEGLRNEREKTDRVLAKWKEGVEEHADNVVDRARENADAVLVTARDNADAVLEVARDKADRMLDDNKHRSAPTTDVAEERLLEDETLQVERSTADESLRRDREEDSRALMRLVPLERESTDRYLLTERVRSDNAVSNRDDFLGIVTHDLRDLLGGIVMSAAVLSRRAAHDEDASRLEIKRIERYAARMHRLIGDLTDVASIDAGRFDLKPMQGDSTSLLIEAVETFRASAAAKGISLVAEAAERPLLAQFDHDRLLQVLANLISNAIKFTRQDGRITVRSERAGGELRFCVKDTGAGMPEQALESIFERFWQVGKNDRRGMGLGLYISRCIVEAHGGRIWADSKLGEGSAVCFTLPCAK